MIRFAYSFESDFLKKFMDSFFVPKILVTADLVKNSCFEKDYKNYRDLSFILDKYHLQKIIFCKPANLNILSCDIFNRLPILADYYHPAYIFKNLMVDTSILLLKGRSAQEAYPACYMKLLVELTLFKEKYNSYRSIFLYNELIINPSITTLKKIIRKIVLLQTTGVSLSKEEVKFYPTWVRLFQTIFDYDYLSKYFGYDIVKSSKLDVCPYCNAEDLRIIEGRKRHRPDIDHFLPKSKYPFFATSIYNLIPSGDACNRSFKRDLDLINGYINPLVRGIEKNKLFNFRYIDVDVEENIFIGLNNIPSFALNAELFELSEVYKHKRYYESYSNMRNIYKEILMIVAQGDISRKKELMEVFFHTSKSCRVMKDKKFKDEALKHIIEKFEPLIQRMEQA